MITLIDARDTIKFETGLLHDRRLSTGSDRTRVSSEADSEEICDEQSAPCARSRDAESETCSEQRVLFGGEPGKSGSGEGIGSFVVDEVERIEMDGVDPGRSASR